MSSELRLPHVRISQRHLGECPDVEVDGVLLNGVTEFEFKPPHRLTLVLEVGRLEALREPLHPPQNGALASPCDEGTGGHPLDWMRGRSGEVMFGPGAGMAPCCVCGAPRLSDGGCSKGCWLPISTRRYMEPMRRGSISGCYRTSLTCDRRDSAVHRWASPVGGTENFVGETLADTLRKARKSGWEITEKQVLCPACAGSTKVGES